ncbi:PBSX family phage terminase large subunit [Pediococcus ethanolidurans]|uniref:PBSX family phage terminase large subunit n=1 Tax=Pediococcus ethanolidurans TaxID=319653 RepID=UPI002952B171|nr:terminase large subunit [Pediococcus ethanolidurans]
MVLTYIPTGQQIRFKGVDKPKKVKSQKFRHGYTKFIHYEECDEFNGLVEIRSVNQSLNRGGDGIITFYSYNPPASQNNWVNQAVAQAGTRKDTMVHSSDYLTVPKRWLGKGFLADAEQLKKDNPVAYNHEYLGEITGTGAEVFTNLNLREITDREIANFDRNYPGLDFGFAHDPLVYLDMYYDATHRRLFIYNELYKVGLGNRAAVQAIKALNPDNELIIADSAEPRTVYEFHDAGLNIKGMAKGKGFVEYSTKWLQDLRTIVIDPIRCPNTAREFSGYELDRDQSGNLISRFPDRDNHSIDAARYAMQPMQIRGVK